MENNIKVWEARVTQQEATRKRLETARSRAAQRLAEDPDVGRVVLWEVTPHKWLFGAPD